MLAAMVGGSPAWWLRQDDKMLATGIAVATEIHARERVTI